MVNGSAASIHHIGKFIFPSPHNASQPLILTNIMHVPNISKDLLSVSQFTKENNVYFEFHSDSYYVKSQRTNQVLLEGRLKYGLYTFDEIKIDSSPFSVSCLSSSAQICNNSNNSGSIQQCNSHGDSLLSTWHAILGHASSKIVSLVLNKCKVTFSINNMNSVCDACCLGKSHKLPFHDSLTTYTQPLQLIYSDIWGPAPMSSTNGNRYYIHFMDAYSRFTWIYLLQTKSQALASFIHFKTIVENQLGSTIKVFQSDGGKEYAPFTQYLNSFGAIHRFSSPYIHEQNGVAERKHRHITKMGLSILANASMPLKYWG